MVGCGGVVGPCHYCYSLSPKIGIWDFRLIFWTQTSDQGFRLVNNIFSVRQNQEKSHSFSPLPHPAEVSALLLCIGKFVHPA